MKLSKILLSAAALLCAVGMASCSPESETTYEVTYYDEETILKTETVKAGEKATRWTPEKENYSFVEWYGTPNYKFKFDFDQPIEKDTSIYALFQSDDFVEDTRPWAIVGNGTGKVLSTSGFGATIGEEHLLTRSDKAGVNEYTITLDLEVGDEFQFAIDSEWSNQRGGGYLKETGLNGVEHFEVKASHLSTNTAKCNIGVKVSGNYTLTLTTYPGADYYDTEDAYYTEADKERFNYNPFDTITWVRNGDVTETVDTVYDLYVKGNLITGWQHLTDDEYKMQYDSATKTYTYTHQFYDCDEFMFYSLADGGLGPVQIKYGQVDEENSTDKITGNKEKDTNFQTLANGTYSFTYSLETRVCVVTYDPEFTLVYTPNSEWYIVGGGSSELLSISNWGRKDLDDRFRLNPTEEALTYSITLDLQVNDEFQIVKDNQWGLAHGYSYLQNPETDGTTYFTDTGNIQCKVAGNYTLTLHVSDTSQRFDTITWVRNSDVLSQPVKTYDVYCKIESEDWEPRLIGSVLSNNEITVTLELDAGDKLCFVYTDEGEEITVMYPGNLIRYTALGEANETNANANFSTNDDLNFVCDVSGRYEFTIDYSEGSPVVNTVKLPDAVSFEVIIKGTMTGWANSERYASVDGAVRFEYTFAENDEFGFAWYDETTTTSYGNWIGAGCMGTDGTANDAFEGENNYKCVRAGTYIIEIVKSVDDAVTVNFYNI